MHAWPATVPLASPKQKGPVARQINLKQRPQQLCLIGPVSLPSRIRDAAELSSCAKCPSDVLELILHHHDVIHLVGHLIMRPRYAAYTESIKLLGQLLSIVLKSLCNTHIIKTNELLMNASAASSIIAHAHKQMSWGKLGSKLSINKWVVKATWAKQRMTKWKQKNM